MPRALAYLIALALIALIAGIFALKGGGPATLGDGGTLSDLSSKPIGNSAISHGNPDRGKEPRP